eukprot:TRINITY_DN35996_c0_g1_i1.p1 TRINITY_DN35996_c0_g1~~TRINITY_DN35996_c0_g1_i1.p1  ORF type:complete len:153 (+),score=51.56 TRINITY_DN35996_c0_g1_i1:68-526(+)
MADQDTQAELQEIWNLFSEISCRARQVQDNSIATTELLSVLRALGQNPTDEEATALLQRADPHQQGVVHFNTFLQMAAGLTVNAEQEIVEAFRTFDQDGKGVIHSSALRHIMTNLGEKFDDLEVDEMIREAGVMGIEGDVRYEEFARKITTT